MRRLLLLAAAAAAAVGVASAAGAGDGLAHCSVNDVTQTEGTTTQDVTPFEFTVTCEAPSGVTIDLQVETRDGSATAQGDYVSATHPISYTSGADTVHNVSAFQVDIVADSVLEPDETFDLVLTTSDPDVTFDKALGVVTILNDDQPAPCIILKNSNWSDEDDLTVLYAGTISATRHVASTALPLKVENCGSGDVSLIVSGTDATGPHGTWELVTPPSPANTCDLGHDKIVAALDTTMTPGSDEVLFGAEPTPVLKGLPGGGNRLPAGATWPFFFHILLPCTGSVGAPGDDMTMHATFTAVTP